MENVLNDSVDEFEIEDFEENPSKRCRLPPRLAKQSKKICAKEERNASLKKVAQILQKSLEKRTPEETKILRDCSDTVDEIHERWRKRDEAKRRLEEFEDPEDVLRDKCQILAQAIAQSQHLVVYTGAGISTAAKIPDYRGPNGIWTRLQQGKEIGEHDLSSAVPTYTHMALYELYRKNILKYVVSQNCDGLHLRSGLPRTALSELHGNMYVEICKKCKPHKEYWRLFDVTENTARFSHKTSRRCYVCNEPLIDSIVHFGERGCLQWPLNWAGACKNSEEATTILCLGSSLKVLKKYPWLWQMNKPAKCRPNLYIVNLQWTPKDDCANVKLHGKCDFVMKTIMEMLGLKVPQYEREKDPIFAHCTEMHEQELHTTTQPLLREILKTEVKKEEENRGSTESNALVKSEREAGAIKSLDVKKSEDSCAITNGSYLDLNKTSESQNFGMSQAETSKNLVESKNKVDHNQHGETHNFGMFQTKTSKNCDTSENSKTIKSNAFLNSKRGGAGLNEGSESHNFDMFKAEVSKNCDSRGFLCENSKSTESNAFALSKKEVNPNQNTKSHNFGMFRAETSTNCDNNKRYSFENSKLSNAFLNSERETDLNEADPSQHTESHNFSMFQAKTSENCDNYSCEFSKTIDSNAFVKSEGEVELSKHNFGMFQDQTSKNCDIITNFSCKNSESIESNASVKSKREADLKSHNLGNFQAETSKNCDNMINFSCKNSESMESNAFVKSKREADLKSHNLGNFQAETSKNCDNMINFSCKNSESMESKAFVKSKKEADLDKSSRSHNFGNFHSQSCENSIESVDINEDCYQENVEMDSDVCDPLDLSMSPNVSPEKLHNCDISNKNKLLLKSLPNQLVHRDPSLFTIDTILQNNPSRLLPKKHTAQYLGNSLLNPSLSLLGYNFHQFFGGYTDLFLYPYQTSLLYPGLHSIINPIPFFKEEEAAKSVVKKEPVKITPTCDFCKKHYNSDVCLFYAKTEPVFLKKQFRFSKVENKEKLNVCLCCDYTTEEEDNVIEEESSNSSFNEKNKIQAGWFGKGYRKNKRKKKSTNN